MKTLVIYDSTYGNTEQIARIVGRALSAQTPAQVKQVAEVGTLDLQAGDILIVGCPTQAHTVTPAMRTWLKRLQPRSLQGVYVAGLDTRYRGAAWLTGVAANRIAKVLQQVGGTLLVPAESFFVDGSKPPTLAEGELDRVTPWAEALFREMQQRQAAKSTITV